MGLGGWACAGAHAAPPPRRRRPAPPRECWLNPRPAAESPWFIAAPIACVTAASHVRHRQARPGPARARAPAATPRGVHPLDGPLSAPAHASTLAPLARPPRPLSWAAARATHPPSAHLALSPAAGPRHGPSSSSSDHRLPVTTTHQAPCAGWLAGSSRTLPQARTHAAPRTRRQNAAPPPSNSAIASPACTVL